MRLSPTPDLGSTRRLLFAAVVVWLLVCGVEASGAPSLKNFGDTDDAMRLFIVRDLVAGRGWYDQWIGRLQPPQGLFMHWSRLLDGGLAGMMLALRPFLGAARAELTTRYVWPLIWILPAVISALVVARNLGGRAAVLLTAILLAFDLPLYRQFIPGRIDHHNLQIVMAVSSLACALARRDRARWAAVGGVATALGLAIGLEALPMQALVGAGYGLALARDRGEARVTGAYGAALAVASLAFFLAQTPPSRWGLPVCDALGVNLAAALAVAGVGLAAAALSSRKAPAWLRLAMLAIAGAAAGATYLAIAPQCLHGPFADMNPAVRSFWFNRIQEVQALPAMLKLARQAAIIASIMMLMALTSAAFLAIRSRRTGVGPPLLALAMVLVACVTAWFTWRMQDYVFWIGIPILGAAFSLLAARRLRDLFVPSVIATVLLSPWMAGVAVGAIAKPSTKASRVPANPGPRCFSPGAYRALAALPQGAVLAPTDMGPFILLAGRHAALVAPYHRMSTEILAAHGAFDATPPLAEARVKALGATYLVDCPPYPLVVGPGSLGSRLRTGWTPDWLERLSGPKDTLQIYRVKG